MSQTTTEAGIAQNPLLAAVPGKSPDRVPAYYQKYPKEWNAQYNMLLPDGITCSSCAHCQRCCTIFGQKETDTACQFYPTRFRSAGNGG